MPDNKDHFRKSDFRSKIIFLQTSSAVNVINITLSERRLGTITKDQILVISLTLSMITFEYFYCNQ